MKFKAKQLILICVISFLLPIIIHVLYSFSSYEFLISKWTAGDLLVYFGTIVSVIFAWISINSTLKENQKLHDDTLKNNQHLQMIDTYNKVRPYIALEKLFYDKNIPDVLKYAEDKFNNNINNSDISIGESNNNEYTIDQLCFIITDSDIEIRKDLSEKEKEIINFDGNFINAKEKGIIECQHYDCFWLFLMAKNVGQGCAVNLNIGIRKKGCKECMQSIPFILDKKEGLKVKIFSYVLKENEVDEYELLFMYDDIYKNEFIQIYNIFAQKGHVEILLADSSNNMKGMNSNVDEGAL